MPATSTPRPTIRQNVPHDPCSLNEQVNTSIFINTANGIMKLPGRVMVGGVAPAVVFSSASPRPGTTRIRDPPAGLHTIRAPVLVDSSSDGLFLSCVSGNWELVQSDGCSADSDGYVTMGMRESDSFVVYCTSIGRPDRGPRRLPCSCPDV